MTVEENRRASLRDVAKWAGVSPATASMALRGLARVPVRTRERVELAAAALGYIRDPEIGNVLARSRKQAVYVRETIAFLCEIPADIPSARAPWIHQAYSEARRAAHLLACEVESLVIPKETGRMREMGRRLWLRGVRGILVCPITLSEQSRIDLDWEKFSAVEIGATLTSPRLHRVERLFFEDCCELFSRLEKSGRKRIGLALTTRRRRFLRDIPEAALLLHRQRHPDAADVESLGETFWNPKGFASWIRNQRPDCIVIYEKDPLQWLEALPSRLRAGVGVAHLDAADSMQTGLQSDVSSIIREAVELVVRMIRTGERGIPLRCRSHGFRNLVQMGRMGGLAL